MSGKPQDLNSAGGRTVPLLYGDRLMRPAPVGYETLDEFVDTLHAGSGPNFVLLEPGDGTRYQLLIVPVTGAFALANGMRSSDPFSSDWWYVQRFYGAQPFGPGVFLDDTDALMIHEIAGPNPWTRQFLSWWFDEFFAAVDAWRAS